MNDKSGPFSAGFPLARMVSVFVLLVIIGLLGFVFLRVMAGFWLPLFLAALLVVIFQPLHQWILDACEGKQKRAAVLTTLAILLVVLGPLAWVGTVAVSEAKGLFSRPWADEVKEIQTRTSGLRARLNLDMPFSEQLTKLEDAFQQLMSQHDVEDGQATVAIDREFCRRRIEQMKTAVDELQERIRKLPASDTDGQFAVTAEDLNSLKMQIDEVYDLTPGKDQIEITGIEARDCGQRLDQAFLTFRGLKQELMEGSFRIGGPFRAWFIELANPSASQLHEWQSKAFRYLQETVVSLTGQTTAFVIGLLFGVFVLIISLYYFLVDGPNLIRAAMRLSPLEDKYEAELFAEFAKVSRAVVLATLLSAVAQAILAGIGYAIVGAGPLFLLTLVTGLLAMVPFVGAAAVWLPVALWVAFLDQAPGAAEAGRLIPGIGLAIYGVVVVSMADNVIKPWVLHGQSNLHPLLALLSVLGGVKTLGPIGLLVGPMIVSFLQALLNMLNIELGEDSGKATESG